MTFINPWFIKDMDIINVCVQFVKLCLCSSFPVPPVVFVLCRCLILSHANEEYLNLKSDRQETSLCFSLQAVLTFNYVQPTTFTWHKLFIPSTNCMWVCGWVRVCVCTHSCLSFCVCMCVDSFEANSSFIPHCVSAAFTFCSAHFSFMLWFKNSSKFWVF